MVTTSTGCLAVLATTPRTCCATSTPGSLSCPATGDRTARRTSGTGLVPEGAVGGGVAGPLGDRRSQGLTGDGVERTDDRGDGGGVRAARHRDLHAVVLDLDVA